MNPKPKIVDTKAVHPKKTASSSTQQRKNVQAFPSPLRPGPLEPWSTQRTNHEEVEDHRATQHGRLMVFNESHTAVKEYHGILPCVHSRHVISPVPWDFVLRIVDLQVT